MLVTAPKGEPVAVRIDTYRKLPKSTPKRVESQPDTVGGKDSSDLDNTIKLVLDGLNGSAWVDDCQVTRIVAERHDRTRRTTDLMVVEVRWGDDVPTASPAGCTQQIDWNGHGVDVETMTLNERGIS
jgi:hypothetical protein